MAVKSANPGRGVPLSAMQREILRRLLGGMRQIRIAEEMGISRQRVSQIVMALRARGYWS